MDDLVDVTTCADTHRRYEKAKLCDSRPLMRAMCEMLGLDQRHVKRIVIETEVGTVPQISVERFLNADECDKLAEAFKK